MITVLGEVGFTYKGRHQRWFEQFDPVILPGNALDCVILPVYHKLCRESLPFPRLLGNLKSGGLYNSFIVTNHVLHDGDEHSVQHFVSRVELELLVWHYQQIHPFLGLGPSSDYIPVYITSLHPLSLFLLGRANDGGELLQRSVSIWHTDRGISLYNRQLVVYRILWWALARLKEFHLFW